jgi:hypothetical protein
MRRAGGAVFAACALALGACAGPPTHPGPAAAWPGAAGASPGPGALPPAAPSAASLVVKGAGCGKALPADQPLDGQVAARSMLPGFRPFSVELSGATMDVPVRGATLARSFSVRVPRDYDPGRAYRTVYVMTCNDPRNALFAMWDVAAGGSDEAIYVVVDSANPSSCFDVNTGLGSSEWEAFAAIHDIVDQTYCVDENRVFVAGDGQGANVAKMWGCYFSGDGAHPPSDPSAPRAFAPRFRIRGQLGEFGIPGRDLPRCNGPVAAVFIDAEGPLAPENVERQRVFAMNGCQGVPFAPWHAENAAPGKCFQYTGCPDDYPVVSCVQSEIDLNAQAIAAATMLFSDLAARAPE